MQTEFYIHYCDASHLVIVADSEGGGGGEDRLSNSSFTINASAQTIGLVSYYCVETLSVPEGWTYEINNFQILINVPKNTLEVDRDFFVTVTFCDGKTAQIDIHQTRIYYRYVDVSGDYLCDVCPRQ